MTIPTWQEEFKEKVPIYDGIMGNYVYLKDLEPFIEQEIISKMIEEIPDQEILNGVGHSYKQLKHQLRQKWLKGEDK